MSHRTDGGCPLRPPAAPVPISWPEVLELLSPELGEPVTFRSRASGSSLSTLTGAGVPAGTAERTWIFRVQAFDPAAASFERRVDVWGLDDPEAGEVLLRLHEGPVGDHRLLTAVVETVAVPGY